MGSSFARNLTAFLDSRDLTQESFGRMIGKSQGAVSQWLAGNREPASTTLNTICEVFGLERDDFISERAGFYAKLHGLTDAPAGAIAPKASESAFLPLRGRVHAGNPQDPQSLDGMVELPASVAAGHPNAYFLEVEGDCMDKVYPEGCLILIDPDRMPADGSVAAVTIDGTDYVMRRLHKGATSMMLSPESNNPVHKDIVVTQGDGRTVSLVGTVVWYQPAREME